jgi:alpha-L-fucosidase
MALACGALLAAPRATMCAGLPAGEPARQSGGSHVTYTADWASIDSRPIPKWFEDAKFGIFIHWGVYSVPGWGPKGSYAEWYWHNMQDHNGPTWRHHAQTFGADFPYQSFAPMFKAEDFDPADWAGLFKRSGAKYVVLTSKHHEGFCLWPSAQSKDWNSVDVGPHRDLLGDLTKAVRGAGLKMGLYYSLYEWFNPLYHSNLQQYVADHMLPQLKDLVTRYQPSLIFTDGEWDHPSADWRSTEFLSWLYNNAPNKEEVVVDDRWGKETRSVHGGYYTTEYGDVGAGKKLAEKRKWEECRGIGASFGYNRNEDENDYKSGPALIEVLVNIVSRGGNLLLDIGPTAEGRVPQVMQDRLLEIGAWLKVNGEAIYGTHEWREPAEGKWIRYTAKGSAVYAILLDWPGGELTLATPKAEGSVTASLLGSRARLICHAESDGLHIQLPAGGPKPGSGPAWVVKLAGTR